MSNNNPVLDEYTIKVSPFGGESDICPRDESGAFSCMEFQGTNIQWSNENVYRLAIALFPPNPEVLKAICFRGYKDAITFLRARSKQQPTSLLRSDHDMFETLLLFVQIFCIVHASDTFERRRA